MGWIQREEIIFSLDVTPVNETQIFTFGLSSLLRTLSHSRAPVFQGLLGLVSPSSSKLLSSSLQSLSLILTCTNLSQLQTAALTDWMATGSTISQTAAAVHLSPSNQPLNASSLRIPTNHHRCHVAKLNNHKTVQIVFTSRRCSDPNCSLPEWEKKKAGQAARSPLLFYFPDGFGGLALENPLLPSLQTCSRLLIVLAANPAPEVGSS